MAEGELPPFAPEWLVAEQMSGGRMTLMPGPIDDVRTMFKNVFAGIRPFLPPPSDAVKTVDSTLPSGRKIRVYQPTNSEGKLPIGLYIHSGGWFAGDIGNEDHLARNIAENSQIVLVQVDYRLCPEDPFPAGLDDCCETYEWMSKHAATYGADGTKRFIMGGSCGGNLTTAVALKYASHPELKASGLMIACPSVCDRRALPEEYKQRWTPEKYVDAPMIGREIMDWAFELYKAPSPSEPLSSVLLHPDIKLLPPSYIAAPTKDPTHQETVFLYEEMKKQGVKADLVEWEGFPHFFWIIPMLKESSKFMDVWNEKLRGLIRGA